MFKRMDKKIILFLRSKSLHNWTYDFLPKNGDTSLDALHVGKIFMLLFLSPDLFPKKKYILSKTLSNLECQAVIILFCGS